MFVKVLYFHQICKRFRDGPFVPEFLPPFLFLFFPGEDSLFLATAVVFQIVVRRWRGLRGIRPRGVRAFVCPKIPRLWSCDKIVRIHRPGNDVVVVVAGLEGNPVDPCRFSKIESYPATIGFVVFIKGQGISVESIV